MHSKKGRTKQEVIRNDALKAAHEWRTKMNRIWKKGLLIITTCLMMSAAACGKKEDETSQSVETTETEEKKESEETVKEETEISLNLWYTDDTITAYLQQAVDTFEEENNISVNLVPTSSVDYLEAINQNNISGEQKADIYILNSTSLEKAYLAGLTLEIPEEAYDKNSYPETANVSVIYQGKTIAYPFYFETEFFLYNKNFSETAPASFQDIIDFAQNYEGTYEGIESILKWDVLDLFYSYGFMGAYANLGGPYGDDRTIIDLNNEKVIDALTFFKQLNQSLYFDASEVEYTAMLSEFLEGKILYTIAGTQSLSALVSSDFNYGIAPLPNLTAELESKGISTNYVAVVNPYTSSEEMAQKLAASITDSNTASFYELTGKLPCKLQDSSIYPNGEFVHIIEAYEKSTQLPKLMDATNFWVEAEVTLNNIWKSEMREEEAQENLSDDSQAVDDGTDEWKKQKVEQQIRDLVTKEINRIQQQMELQLTE